MVEPIEPTAEERARLFTGRACSTSPARCRAGKACRRCQSLVREIADQIRAAELAVRRSALVR